MTKKTNSDEEALNIARHLLDEAYEAWKALPHSMQIAREVKELKKRCAFLEKKIKSNGGEED